MDTDFADIKSKLTEEMSSQLTQTVKSRWKLSRQV